jgi:hypothetical protein
MAWTGWRLQSSNDMLQAVDEDSQAKFAAEWPVVSASPDRCSLASCIQHPCLDRVTPFIPSGSSHQPLGKWRGSGPTLGEGGVLRVVMANDNFTMRRLRKSGFRSFFCGRCFRFSMVHTTTTTTQSTGLLSNIQSTY